MRVCILSASLGIDNKIAGISAETDGERSFFELDTHFSRRLLSLFNRSSSLLFKFVLIQIVSVLRI